MNNYQLLENFMCIDFKYGITLSSSVWYFYRL